MNLMHLLRLSKTSVAAVTALLILLGTAQSALAQGADVFPNRPVKWIVPYPPGGLPDRLARTFGQRLQKVWGQTVIVENMPGANSLIANNTLTRLPADGYTLIMVNPVIGAGHVLYPTANWPADPLSTFAPVTRLIKSPNVIVVPANSPYHSIGDLIAHSRKTPTRPELYGVPTLGSPVQLGMEEFAEIANFKISTVPFKGGPDLMGGLIGGHIGLAADNLSNSLPHIRSGKLRGLMVMSSTRHPLAPEIQSSTDAGYGTFERMSWHGVAMRSGTPKPIVEKIARDIALIAKDPEIKKQFEELGDIVDTTTPDEFTDLIRTESARMTKLIKRLNITGQ